MDAYSVLGVSASASDTQIRQAYRRLAQKWHPDRRGGSHEQFVRLQECYACISTPAARAEYDRQLREKAQAASQEQEAAYSPGSNFDLRQKWQEWQQQKAAARQQARAFAPRGDHASVRVVIPLRELIEGTTRRVLARVAQICPQCQGEALQCVLCRGSGQRFIQRQFEVSIPPGAAHGSYVCLKGVGHDGPMFSGPGDVLVQVWWEKAFGWTSREGEWWKTISIRGHVYEAGSIALRAPDGSTGTIRWGETDRHSSVRVLKVPGLGPRQKDGSYAPAWVELKGR